MKKLFATLLVVPMFLATLTAADLTGVWTLSLEPDFGGNPASVECAFEQEGRRLTVRCGGGAPGKGEVIDRKVVFEMKTGPNDEFIATFTATLDDQAKTMKGTWHLVANETKDGLFSARKQ